MTNNRLKDRRIIVFGSATGIGAATVRRLAEEGARVCAADINLEGATQVAQEAGGETFAVYVDISDEASVQKATEEGSQADDVAIVRVEQIYPFHPDRWNEIAEKYENVKEWVWVSEEPVNYGAWAFMRQHLEPP